MDTDAHGYVHPDEHAERDTNPQREPHTHLHQHAVRNTNGFLNLVGNADLHCDCITILDLYQHTDEHTDPDGHVHLHSDANGDGHHDADADPDR